MVDAPKGTKKTTTSGGGGTSSTPKGGSSTPSTSTQKPFSNPLTGDTKNIILWIVLLVTGGIFAGSFWYARKEMEKENNN